MTVIGRMSCHVYIQRAVPMHVCIINNYVQSVSMSVVLYCSSLFGLRPTISVRWTAPQKVFLQNTVKTLHTVWNVEVPPHEGVKFMVNGLCSLFSHNAKTNPIPSFGKWN